MKNKTKSGIKPEQLLESLNSTPSTKEEELIEKLKQFEKYLDNARNSSTVDVLREGFSDLFSEYI